MEIIILILSITNIITINLCYHLYCKKHLKDSLIENLEEQIRVVERQKRILRSTINRFRKIIKTYQKELRNSIK